VIFLFALFLVLVFLLRTIGGPEVDQVSERGLGIYEHKLDTTISVLGYPIYSPTRRNSQQLTTYPMEIVGYDSRKLYSRERRGFATGPLPPRRRVRGSVYF
jgi:hypothetical protein